MIQEEADWQSDINQIVNRLTKMTITEVKIFSIQIEAN